MSQFTSALQSLQSFFIAKRLPNAEQNIQLRLETTDYPKLVASTSTATNIKADAFHSNVHVEQIPQRSSVPVFDTFLNPTVMYISESAPVLQQPYKAFDTQIKCMEYGDAVTVVAWQGAYAKVQKGEVIGWVSKNSLVKRKVDIWPQWKFSHWYGADHAMTRQARQLIKDEFFAGASDLALQSVEYVTLALLEDNRRILWPQTYGRVAGRWHYLLRGTTGIHISIQPCTDSVMEWTTEEGIGHVAYVRKVLPDNTLHIEGIDILEEGLLEQVTLPESLWREWRPVFIEVS